MQIYTNTKSPVCQVMEGYFLARGIYANCCLANTDMSCGRDIDTLRCRDIELCELVIWTPYGVVICALRRVRMRFTLGFAEHITPSKTAYHAAQGGISRKPLAFYITVAKATISLRVCGLSSHLKRGDTAVPPLDLSEIRLKDYFIPLRS